MKDNVVFTICAKNYIGLAQILEKSLMAHHVDTDFLIFVADEFLDEELIKSLPENVIIAKNAINLDAVTWADMSFKYNLTEFCTSIKPAVFLYLLNHSQYKNIVYLDPDIYIFSSLSPLFTMLDNHSIVLTPHMTKISEKYNGQLPDTDFLGNGIFNLGFCGIRNDSVAKKMILWWHSKLITNCFIDPYFNTFTDQKWMDYLPGFFTSEELLITKHLGCNIAPWNFFERNVTIQDEKLMVSPRDSSDDSELYPVLFVHFSGYNYKELKEGNVIQNNIASLEDYDDIKLLTQTYAEAIKSNRAIFDQFIHLDYTYNSFKDGCTISIFHRRLYRSLVHKGEDISDPFYTGEGSFYHQLKQQGMLIKSSVNIDKVNKGNLKGIDSKLVWFNRIMKLCYKLIGLERYLLLIRLLRPYSRYESQIHLLNRRYEKDNI